MRTATLTFSILALATGVGAADAASVGVSSWDAAIAASGEKDLPVLLEFSTEW